MSLEENFERREKRVETKDDLRESSEMEAGEI